MPDVKNSAAFFQSLPWKNGTPIARIHETTVSSNILSSVDAPRTVNVSATLDISSEDVQGCAVFFRTLPWQGQSASPIVVPLSTRSSSPKAAIVEHYINTDVPKTNSCAIFFQSLPWNGQVHTPLATLAYHDDAVYTLPIGTVFDDDFISTEVSNASINNSSAFFHSLPWQGQARSIDKMTVLSAMNSDDFMLIANLATQTALSAAQRNNNEDNVIPPPTGRNTASGFFQTLPW